MEPTHRIPAPELDFLRLNCQRAWDLAQEGRRGDGYTRLLVGLERVRTQLADHAAWSVALEVQWHQALEEFCIAFSPGW